MRIYRLDQSEIELTHELQIAVEVGGAFAEAAGRDPPALLNANQLPIYVGPSRAALEAPMMEWLGQEWDFAAWSDSTKDAAVFGTVEECVGQLRAQLAAGVQKLIFIPYRYRADQVEIIAREIIPRLRGKQ